MGSKTVKADGTVTLNTTTAGDITNKLSDATKKATEASTKIEEILKAGVTTTNKGNLKTALQTPETEIASLKTAIETALKSIEEALEDKNISKNANEAYTALKEKLTECNKINTEAKDAIDTAKTKSDAVDATEATKKAAEEAAKTALEKLSSLKTGIEEVTTAFEEAYNITNSQMTSLDELRTTLQGFVAKPNDVNLDHTSFTTFLDVY